MRHASHEVLPIAADTTPMWRIPEKARSLSTQLYLTAALSSVAIILVLIHGTAARAAIYACASSNASVIYQDRPCPLETRAAQTAAPTQTHPLGIHESWFKLPEYTDGRAFCDRRGCECGRIERKHQGGLSQAVADSLYLDGYWHRFETAYQIWLNLPGTSTENYLRREEMLEASCEVMMSQQLLRSFADDVQKVLARKVQQAEERGFDIAEPCLQEIPDACAHYEAVKLHTQMLNDVRALKKVRVSTARKNATNSGSGYESGNDKTAEVNNE